MLDMDTAAIREILHQYIDASDDDHIVSMLQYVENQKGEPFECTPEELKELHRRADMVLNGSAIMYTAEDAHEYIRNSRKKR